MAKQFDKHWYPFYHDLFNRSVAGWSSDRVGAYILLLNHQWQNNGIPKDKDELIFIARCSEQTLDRVLFKFEIEKSGRLFNKKMETIRKEQIAKYEKRANAGKQGGLAKKQNLSIAKALPQQSSTIKKEKKKKKESVYISEDRYREILTPLNFSNAIKKNMMEHFRNRVDTKKDVTERAAKMLVNPIEGWVNKYGEVYVIETIQKSIKANYPDIYEPKIQNGQKQEQPQQNKPTRFLGEE